jgi:lipopolysaccharide export system permease protein
MMLETYLLRRLGVNFVLVSGIFFGMMLLVDMIEQMRRLSSRSPAFLDVLHLSLLNTPRNFHEILPLILLLAAMWLGLTWSRASEFVVIRASGKSVARLMAVPVLVILLSSAGMVAAINPIVAATSRAFDASFAELRGRASSAALLSGRNIWLRQATPDGYDVIHAHEARDFGASLLDVTILRFSPTGEVVQRLRAETAQLGRGVWNVQNARLWDLQAPNPEQAAIDLPAIDLPTDLTLERIRDSFGTAQNIPIFALPAFIADLERAGFAAREHRIRLHMELSLPVMLTAMAVLALVLNIYHMRSGRVGLRVLVTIMAGFTLFFLRNFARVLGETGQIPVLLAAWGIPIAAFLLAIGLMLNLEER